MSSVPGFEKEGEKFIADMKGEGVVVKNAADIK